MVFNPCSQLQSITCEWNLVQEQEILLDSFLFFFKLKTPIKLIRSAKFGNSNVYTLHINLSREKKLISSCWSVSWCFESSQPLRIISGLLSPLDKQGCFPEKHHQKNKDRKNRNRNAMKKAAVRYLLEHQSDFDSTHNFFTCHISIHGHCHV